MESVLLQILQAIGLIIGGATIIARLTPTQKDNNFIEKVRVIFEKISNIYLPDNVSKQLKN